MRFLLLVCMELSGVYEVVLFDYFSFIDQLGLKIQVLRLLNYLVSNCSVGKLQVNADQKTQAKCLLRLYAAPLSL